MVIKSFGFMISDLNGTRQESGNDLRWISRNLILLLINLMIVILIYV